MNISKILKNTNLIFGIAIALGFLVPVYADNLKFLLIPALITMMSFSLINFKFSELDFSNLKQALILTTLNTFLLGGLYIILACLFVENTIYRNAVIVLGLMPPAVGIISLIFILKADVNTGFIAELIGYIASILIIPGATLLFFGEAVTIAKIFKILLLVIVVPFFISRIIIYVNNKKRCLPKDTTEIIVNLCYGLLFYITIGVNIDVFLNNFMELFNIILILLFLRFGLGLIIYGALKNKKNASLNTLYVLFGTFKNGSAGMAITVLLFGIRATVPYAIFSIVASFYIVFLRWLLDTKK